MEAVITENDTNRASSLCVQVCDLEQKNDGEKGLLSLFLTHSFFTATPPPPVISSCTTTNMEIWKSLKGS